jgi:hypothetical protein
MLTNEQRAHDLALFYMKNEYDKFIRQMGSKDLAFGEHSFDALEVYLGAYDNILSQLDTKGTLPSGH